MKVKDIKNQLNKETGDNTPDVLESVKASPINKLKKDEKNLVAFKKTMATLILAFLLVILVVLSIAIHGMMIFPFASFLGYLKRLSLLEL